MRSLVADAALQHGLNPYANIIDELHAHRTADLYTALTTGTGAREQPFTLWISTAGVDGPGILAELHESMFDGPGELEERGSLLIYRDRVNGVLIWWYGAPRDADIEDPAVWLGANPASWLRDGKYLRRSTRGSRPVARSSSGAATTSTSSWAPRKPGCRDGAVARRPTGDLPARPGAPGRGRHRQGPDERPLGAIVVAQRQGDRVVVRAQVFPPHPAPAGSTPSRCASTCATCAARSRCPRRATRRRSGRCPGPAFAYDRWAFGESAETLEQEGLAMVDFPQNATTMGPPPPRPSS